MDFLFFFFFLVHTKPAKPHTLVLKGCLPDQQQHLGAETPMSRPHLNFAEADVLGGRPGLGGLTSPPSGSEVGSGLSHCPTSSRKHGFATDALYLLGQGIPPSQGKHNTGASLTNLFVGVTAQIPGPTPKKLYPLGAG